jgi:ribosomal protein S18 acetylase RimI-like enzyme
MKPVTPFPRSFTPFTIRATSERFDGVTSHFLRAMNDGEELGYVRYERRPGKLAFITGVTVHYEWRGRGIARALLDELADREYPGRRLGVNSARENTPEGEALLSSWAAARGIVLVRIDEGLDGA